MRSALLVLLSLSYGVYGQISRQQQKALNNFIDYADNSAGEMSLIVESVIEYYPSLEQLKKNKNAFVKRYVCPVRLDEYHFNMAVAESKALGVTATVLTQKLNALKEAATKIDLNCKALDTYHKLEDYKKDNFQGAERLINNFPDLLRKYKEALAALANDVDATFIKYSGAPSGVNDKAITLMRKQMAHEKEFIDLWIYNLDEDTPTGWPDERLAESILATDKFVKEAKQMKLDIKYPASSMFSSFNEGMATILELKRSAQDAYNAEAKKSDRHANETYLGLINYYNGVLGSFHNNFIDYAQQEGYYGIKAASYVPLIEIRNSAKEEKFQVRQFQDIPHIDLQISQQAGPVSVNGAVALNNYVDFINEGLRQSRDLQMSIEGFSSSAAYYKELTSYQGKSGLDYRYNNFEVPRSQFQKTVTESNAIPELYARNLNAQAEVLLSILMEMEELNEELSRETETKRYEQDHLQHIYEVLDRYKFLFETLDDRKEILYNDVRRVYDSYPLKNPQTSWMVSWKALQTLTDHDHEALFQAKDFYRGKTRSLPQTGAIDDQLREVISKEYDNMKGIEKFGRSNGLCPYTPYEDIPQTSRALSEKLQQVGEVRSPYNRHPYHELVYLYNDVVDDYNKFCELSKLGLLKTVHQPERFEMKQSDRSQTTASKQDAAAAVVIATPQSTAPVTKVDESPKAKTQIVHDTVYIEKRDTLYLADPGENLRSMEGYAPN
ncbi:MAG TPA: hypothetical protein VFW11_13855, partial [Cyclobacteriaceae bacterium]|nr:hypothetical protein [Cyclobacteriaceae bacterium]